MSDEQVATAERTAGSIHGARRRQGADSALAPASGGTEGGVSLKTRLAALEHALGPLEGRRISVHEASVKTARVEVQALVISGKQVTLAVFRQLKEEDLIVEGEADGVLLLAGLPWGLVNYFWGKCWTQRDHLHVVWQKGEELRRSCVTPTHQNTVYAVDHPGEGYRKASADQERQWRELHDELVQLDQLFIAV